MTIYIDNGDTHMDLISRESAKAEMDKLMEIHFDRMVVLGKAKDKIESLPSAFEGMTNGEVIQALFPNEKMYEQTETCTYYGNMRFDTEWWNAPYQKGGDDET